MAIFLLLKSIPPGAHWITVRPNGDGSKGQPVLIQPQPDGSAKVIGGAGGSLNHLRLRGVKSKDHYRSEAEKRRKGKQEQRRAQIEADKASGVHQAKQEARADLRQKRKAAERSVIEAVAKKAGWDPQSLEFPEEDYAHLSEKALAKVRDRHHRQLLTQAKDVIKQSRERLVSEAAMKADAGIGELPLHSDDPDHLSVADLDPVKPDSGKALGFNPDYKGRAEAAGLSQAALDAEAHSAKQTRLAGLTEAQRAAAFARGKAAALIREELDGIKTPAAPNADASLLDAQSALDLVKEGKRLSQIEKAAREASQSIDKSPTEPKAFVLEATADADLDAQARDAVAQDLRTVQTVAFLNEVGKIAGGNPEETLGGHIGVGAYNSVNSLALAVGGEALVDRSVVDVLGVAGAAQVLARRLHNDLPSGDLEHVADGMQDWHVNHYMQTSTDALKKARELTEAAKAIDLSDEAATGADLELAQAMNAKRRAAVGDAQRILGQALGEMEANAALVVALKQKPSDHLDVSLGKTTPEQAVVQARALGLQPGDYAVDHVAGDTFLSVHASGLDRLAKPVNRDDIQQVQRNLSIIRGEHDEDDWLPLGVANRPDLAMDVEPGAAPRLAQPFEPGDDLEQSLKVYIGGRAADGDAPADIIADIQSADFFQKVGADRVEAYGKALNTVAPLKGEDGKPRRAEDLAPAFDQYADAFAEKLGGDVSPLNRQKVEIDQHAVDALHRALTQAPEGVAAYKPLGELTSGDQRALREHFHKEIARESPEAAQLRADLEAHVSAEPEKTTTDMFGDEVDNPEWKDWRAHRDNLAEKLGASSLTWPKYVSAMGGNLRAYEALQDSIRSRVTEHFVEAHNRLKPDAPIKLGRATIRHDLRHLGVVDPEARAARQAKDKELIDRLRNRAGGKYASGSVADKMEAAKAEETAFHQAQMGFFSSEELPEKDKEKPLGAGERYTPGHAVERQIAGMMGHVGQNFKPGQPTKLWGISMSGKYVNQQRAIKMLSANKRVGLAFGAGSGKTNIMLGGFAQLHGEGKAKRALMLVPSVVQGQFAGEAHRLLEPGKFKWNIEPGASRESRLAAYRDPETHVAVMTHQSFRDDMIHLGAKHAGIDEDAMVDQLAAMSPAERKGWAASIMAKEGFKFDAAFVDEAHETLNRAGKENSTLANVVDAFSHPENTPHYIYASGDPVKNDASEVHSLMEKMDPERYGDRNAFMRRYGADTIASKQALQREMARYVFPASISPDVDVNRQVERVPLSDAQRQEIEAVNTHLAGARAARRAGKVNVEAARALSPSSFEGLPESEHHDMASRIQQSLGVIRSSAVNRIINTHADNANVDRALKMVAERKGQQGVIFARNRAAVERYQKALEAAGHRVVTVTGSDSAADKDRKRQMFNPEKGEAQADIVVASDAGAVGMNLQSGQYLIQHDIPDTAKTHSQRQARINRLGQKAKSIDLIDLVADHPEADRARDRLARKYQLKDMLAESIDGLDDTGVASAIKARRAASTQATMAL